MNLKLSRTALRELTRLYRGVLMAAIISAAFVASGAKATEVSTAAGLAEALGTGSDITVTGDIAGINTVTTVAGKTNTLNLNENTLSGAAEGTSGFAFSGTGSETTLTGGGTISGLKRPDTTTPTSVNGDEYGVVNVGAAASLTMTGGNWTFSGNNGGLGALNALNGSIEAVVDTIAFENNTSTTQGGGLRHDVSDSAYSNTLARITANKIKFEGNTIGSTTVVGSGAGAMNSRGTMELLGTTNTFENNDMNATVADGRKYKVGGGAVANQSGENSGTVYNATMVIGKADGSSTNTFTGNHSSSNGGAIMNRAVDTDGNATLTINGKSTFSGNTTAEKGGAIYNAQTGTGRTATVVINGEALFENNTANGEANDIYNLGTLVLNAANGKSIVLNGGIDGDAEYKGNTTITREGTGYVQIANALKNQNVTNNGELRLDGADLTGTTIGGNGEVKVVGDSEVSGNTTIEQAIEVEAGQELAINNATIDSTSGNGALTNAVGGVLKITDSTIKVNVNNAGTLVSDPTTYDGVTVTNSGIASFEEDTFKNNAVLANTGVVNLADGVTFQDTSSITGAGTTNLVSGTTHFNNTANSNTINVASGADFDGTLVGGTLNAQNGAIDTFAGSISGMNVALDVNTDAGTIDTFTGATSSTVTALNISGNYGTAESVDVTIGSGLTVNSATQINGGYYTKVEQNGTTLTLSDKLINTSTIRGTDASGETVTIADKAENTNIGTANAKIALSDAAGTVGITGNTTVTGTLKVGTDNVATLTATQTLTHKTIDASSNTISNLDTSMLASGVLSTAISSSSTNTEIASAKAVYDAIDGIESIDSSATVGGKAYVSKVDADAANKNVKLKVTEDGNEVASVTVDGGNAKVAVKGTLEAADGLKIGTSDAVTAVQTTKITDTGSATTLATTSSVAATVGTLSSLKTTAKTDVVTSINEVFDDITVATGTYANITQGQGVGANLISLNNAIGDVNYGDESAVTGSILKTGTGATTTVRGALDALDAAIQANNKIIGTDPTTLTAGGAISGTIGSGSGNMSLIQAVDGLNQAFTNNSVDAGFKTMEVADGSGHSSTLSAITDGSTGSLLNVSTGLKVNGDETVTGTLTVGAANAITGTANTLDMGANALTNVKGLTLTDGTAGHDVVMTASQITDSDSSKHNVLGVAGRGLFTEELGSQKGLVVLNAGGNEVFAATANGIEVGDGTNTTFSVAAATGAVTAGDLTATGIKTVGGSTKTVDIGGTGYTNTITGTKTTISGITQLDDTATTGGLQFGASGQNVNAIDAGSTAQTSASTTKATTLATVATVLKSAENADFTSTETTLVATTIKGALNELGAENAVQNTVIGAAMNANGTANTSALTLKTQGGAAVTDLTTAVNLIGDLSSTGISQTTVAGQIGTVGSTVASRSGTGMAMGTTATVGANLLALDTAIGADMTAIGTGRTTTAFQTAAGNSVNANLTALDATIGADMTVTGGSRTTGTFQTKTSNTVNQNLSALDAAIGADMTAIGTGRTTTAFQTAAGNSVNANLTALDATIGADMTVTGGSRTTTTFQTKTSNTVNQNLSALDAAIGADMTAIGTGRTTTAFQTAAGNSVNANLTALDATIGADVTTIAATTVKTAAGQNNGVVATNTINQNLSALNAAVGDIATLSAGTGATGDAITNGTGTAATTVVQALNNIDATMGNIHGLYDGSTVNSSTIASTVNGHSNLAVGTTVEDHLVSVDNAIGDRSQFGQSHYMQALDSVSNALMDIDHNLYRVEKEMRGGFASMAAMSALVPNARAAGDTQISVGVGAYRDHQGMALGAFHYFNDNILANFGASYGGDKSTMFRAGVTFGW